MGVLLAATAASTARPPTLPLYISIINTSLDIKFSSLVIPVESPTVLRAENTSRITSRIEISCRLKIRKIPPEASSR